MHDCWYHQQKLAQHFPFPISEIDTVQITIDKPTVIVEFYQEEPDVAAVYAVMVKSNRGWIIEIVTR